VLNLLFSSIITNGEITANSFLGATLCSLAIGIFIAFMYTLGNKYSKSYVVTLALLPAIVEVVIMMVNGNIGAGIAVAGAFSLVRFRSAAGTGQEITTVFLAMAVGLATGMGYIGIACVFAVIISGVNLILNKSSFGEKGDSVRTMKITVPEGLDFEGVFDDLFERYTTSAKLEDVRTSGMGSLYKLTYTVSFRNGVSVKAMMDEMRQRNGNLEITCSRPIAGKSDEL
jgi:hypothetical protein